MLHSEYEPIISNFFMLFLAFLLVLFNAFFVAAEFGMVKLRFTQIQIIEDKFGFMGRILAEIHRNLDAYLSACQLGITLASLGLGWIGEPATANLLEPVFRFLGVESPQMIRFISFLTAFSFLSFIHIVVGELMPKSMAIRNPETVSLWTAIPLYAFYWLMYPAIWLLNACSNMMLKAIKLDASRHGEHTYSTPELKFILTSSHLHGGLGQEESEIIEHALDFAELEVSEVMRPRDEMVALDITRPTNELLDKIFKYRYTRYPVYQTRKQNIIGIIHVKDLLPALRGSEDIVDIKSLIRPILKVNHRVPALNLLRKFRTGVHFAIVYKDKNMPVGFVTLDNLLQVILGRIRDEFHRTTVDWTQNPDGTFQVKGDCTVYSLERALDIDIEVEDDNINTLTGLIFQKIDAFPKVGDKIEFEEFDAIVEEIDGAKIETVKIIPKSSE